MQLHVKEIYSSCISELKLQFRKKVFVLLLSRFVSFCSMYFQNSSFQNKIMQPKDLLTEKEFFFRLMCVCVCVCARLCL